MKLKAVLDTNIYISAFLFKGLPAKILNLAISEAIDVFISEELFWEIDAVLKRKFQMKQFQIDTIVGEIKDFANIVIPTKKLNIIKNDPTDNVVLECAQEAQADYIISGDKKHVLSLKKFKKIKILSAKEFLDFYYKSQN